MDNEKIETDGNLLSAETIKSITITGTDKKDYVIERKLPVKAANIFGQYIAQYGFETPKEADKIIEQSNAAVEYTIATLLVQNEKKYPDLTRAKILGEDGEDGLFSEYEIGLLFNLYMSRWVEIATRRMKSETKDKKKIEEAAGEKDA